MGDFNTPFSGKTKNKKHKNKKQNFLAIIKYLKIIFRLIMNKR